MTEANVASQPTFSAPALPLAGVDATVAFSPTPRLANWQRLQFGLFLHWGVYSLFEGSYQGVAQTIGYPEQIKAWMNISDTDYLDAAHRWEAHEWDAAKICDIAQKAGMSYVMITTKHHDGFCMWDTATTDFNIVKHTPFGRDPLAELAAECATRNMKLAFYFSIIDWTQHEAEPYANLNAIPDAMMPYIESQLEELLTNYGPIAELWFDMGGPTPAQSERLAATVRRLQPHTTVMNSRVWNDCGDFEVGGDNDIPPFFQYGPWESVRSIFPAAWSYCTTDTCDRSPSTIPTQVRAAIDDLINVTTGGGQFAYNLGPMPSGAIDPFDAAVMDGIGQWMQRHPRAITGARPTWLPIPTWGRISTSGTQLFLFPTSWEPGMELNIPGLANGVLSARIDGSDVTLPVRRDGNDIVVSLQGENPDPIRPVVCVELDGSVRMAPENAKPLRLHQPNDTHKPENPFHTLNLSATLPHDTLTRHRSAKGYSGGFAAIDAYVTNTHTEHAHNLRLTFTCDPNHQPAPTALYQITYTGALVTTTNGNNALTTAPPSERHLIVSGTQLLNGSIQTDWSILPNAVARIRIEYAQVQDVHTPYYAQGLDLRIDTLRIDAGTQAPQNYAPTILAQPENMRIRPGETALLTVAADAWPQPSYRWRRLGTDPNGANEDTLTPFDGTMTGIDLPYFGVAPTQPTSYMVDIENSAGRTSSVPVQISFLSPEEQLGTTPTVSAIEVTTVMGESLSMSGDGANRIVTIKNGTVLGCSIKVTGDPYPHIQWQILRADAEEWENLANQNAPTWTHVTDMSFAQAKIRVQVSNSAGSAYSGMITVHIS